MSRLPNGNNGRVNGDYSSSSANQNYPRYRDNVPVGVGRTGGYGGFDSGEGRLVNSLDTNAEVLSSVNERSIGTNNGYISSRHVFADQNYGGRQSPSRSRDRDGVRHASNLYGNGPGGRQIEGTPWTKFLTSIICTERVKARLLSHRADVLFAARSPIRFEDG